MNFQYDAVSFWLVETRNESSLQSTIATNLFSMFIVYIKLVELHALSGKILLLFRNIQLLELLALSRTAFPFGLAGLAQL